jgi:serine/threonine protein kinase
MMEFSPGAEIAGYRIESVIGRGGMAVVYRAEDSRLGRKVALKLLAPVLAQNHHFQQRFIRESRLAASLDHPNIVPIFEAGESDGHLFIAMRYVPGSDLKAVLAEEQRLSPARLLRLFVQIGDALDAAHLLGLVHRDVKPGNILVSSVVEHSGHAHPDHVYLTDFGLTKRTSSLSGSLTDTGHFLGTVDYVSPEQIQGGPLSPATDTYALGCVLYEALTGQLPFNRDDDAAVLWAHLVEMPPPVTVARPDLPPAIDDVVNRAMAKAPEDRYDSCSDMMRDLEQALEAVPDLSSLHSAAARPGARHRRVTDNGSSAAPAQDDRGALPGPRGPLGTALPPSADPDATRPWVSHPSLPPGTLEPPRWPRALERDDHGGEDVDLATGARSQHVAAATDTPSGPASRGGAEEANAEDLAHLVDGDDFRDDYADEHLEPDPAAGPAAETASAFTDTASHAGHRRRTRWLAPVGVLVVLAVMGAVAAFVLRSRAPEPFRSHTTSIQESVVTFTVGHPESWRTVPGSNSLVIARSPQMASVFGQGGWGAAGDLVKRSPDQAVGAYFTSLQTPVDPTQDALQSWVITNLGTSSTVTGLSSPTPRTVGGHRGYEMEGVLADASSPRTTLRASFDVVDVPEGTVLMTFFAPASHFEDERPVFSRMVGTVAFPG